MFGAIVGDIIGSVYEFRNIKIRDFPLFVSECVFTDDTVMTVATAYAIMKGARRCDFIASYSYFGNLYPESGYGRGFKQWLISKDKKPYNSCGNGSAMRVSPCAWYVPLGDFEEKEKEVENVAETSAAVSHNHSEGIKGACATALSIYLMRCARSINKVQQYKEVLKKKIEGRFGYDLNRTLDEIRPFYSFDATCQRTVPEAIIAFLESEDFEDAIRGAISIGGDSDTIAAITGSIAEAAYGIPTEIIKKALSFLDDNLKNTIFRFNRVYN